MIGPVLNFCAELAVFVKNTYILYKMIAELYMLVLFHFFQNSVNLLGATA